MQHQLVMFTGSSSGAGKSTLSLFLFEQFIQHRISTEWLYEDDGGQMAAFAPFLRDLQQDSPHRIDSLLGAASYFVAHTMRQGVTYITDSFFPGYAYLVGHYPYQRLEAFTMDLHSTLAPQNPLIIYLNCDVASALQRAVAQRGDTWLQGIAQRVGHGHLTYSPSTTVQDRRLVVPFFEAVHQASLALLAHWRGATLILDTINTPLDQIKVTLLQYFGLSERQTGQLLPADTLYRYVGVYAPRDHALHMQPISITCRDNALFANIYWPNGTRLVAESDTRFRIEATSHWVEFEVSGDEPAQSLTYVLRGNAALYDRATC